MKKILVGLLIVIASVIGGISVDAAGTLPATLTWSNPSDTADGIQVEKSNSATGTFAIINKTAPNVVTYVDGTNSPGDTACYRVAYFNTSGVGPYSGPVCKSFPTIPTQAPATFGVN